jgi:tetratricopeptide (TPR) repeat protein
MDIGWALSDAVSAACHENKLLLVIDDLHNADDLSKEVLAALAQSASSQRLLVLATSRSTSRHQFNEQIGPLKDFRPLAVPPLSLSDATLLVAEFAVSPQRPLSSQATAGITRAGGGNPLFLRELTSQQLSPHIVLSAPQSLVEVIEQRTAHLSPTEVRLLRLISTLGQLATLERIRVLMPSSLGAYDSSLEQLELEGVLSMSTTGNVELHECWHDSLRGALRGTARSAISLDCATLLASESFTDANFSNYWRAAELYAIAGSNDRSRQQFLLVGELFAKRGLPRQAAMALSQAVALAGDGSGREALLTQLAAAQNSASLYSESIESCSSALSLAADPSPDSATTRALALATLVDSQMKLGVDYGDSIGALAVAVSQTEVTDAVCQHACLIALRTIFNSGSRVSPQVFLDASVQSASRFGRSALGLLVRLIYAAERGTASELAVLESELSDGASDGGTPSMRLMTLRYRGTALRFLGRYEDAVFAMTEAVASAKALGAVRDSFLASTSLVFLHLDYANFEQARAWLDAAEALAGPTQGHDLDRTLLHATARYFVDIGDDAECVAAYADYLDDVYADTNMRRAVVDRACLALAFARSGDADVARHACNETIRMLGELTPGINEDWAASTVIRGLYSLGDISQAEALRETYRTRRNEHFNRPIPTGLKEISDAWDNHRSDRHVWVS